MVKGGGSYCVIRAFHHETTSLHAIAKPTRNMINRIRARCRSAGLLGSIAAPSQRSPPGANRFPGNPSPVVENVTRCCTLPLSPRRNDTCCAGERETHAKMRQTSERFTVTYRCRAMRNLLLVSLFFMSLLQFAYCLSCKKQGESP